jgi:hypothetical protein
MKFEKSACDSTELISFAGLLLALALLSSTEGSAEARIFGLQIRHLHTLCWIYIM